MAVSSCAYSGDGRLIAGGLADGTIQLWDVRGKFGHSAAVGVVPQPKAQQVLQPKQTWTYASAPGAHCRLFVFAHGNKYAVQCHAAMLRCPSRCKALMPDDTLHLCLQARSHGERTRLAATLRACDSP